MKNCFFFKKLNLNGPTPLPLFGNFLSVIFKGIIKNDMHYVNKYGKTFGVFEGTIPKISTADVNLIKCILIKDSHYFVNRQVE